MAAWVDLGLPDPLEAHRPAGAACATGSWGPESGSLEVDTGACGFLSVRQPLRAWLEAGDPVELVLWHDWLTAEAPATGHLALFAGEALLFEHLVDIPADPEAYTFTFDSPLSAAPGASVTLHLHNHGANTWNLLRLERVEP